MTLGRISQETIRDEKWAEQQYERAYDYYFAGDWLSAERCLRDAIEVSAFEGRYRLLLAQVYCARGWLNMSYSELECLRNIDPDNAGIHSLEQLLKAKLKQRGEVGRKKRSGHGVWNSVVQLSSALFH